MRKLFFWAQDRDKHRNLTILQQVPLFRGLDRKMLRKLLVDLIEKEYDPGEPVFSEGDPGKALYIIVDGAVSIIKRTGEGDSTLAVLRAGSYFGELALIGESLRYASAVVQKRATLLIMYKSYFDDLISGNSAISSRVLLNLAESLVRYIGRKDRYEGRSDG